MKTYKITVTSSVLIKAEHQQAAEHEFLNRKEMAAAHIDTGHDLLLNAEIEAIEEEEKTEDNGRDYIG